MYEDRGREKIVLDKYVIYEYGMLGCGGFSEVYRGKDLGSGEDVAVKVTLKGKGVFDNLKERRKISAHVKLSKFKRQIAVHEILKGTVSVRPQSRTHANSREALELNLDELFIQLLDYSKSKSGEPGPHPFDSKMYTVIQMAHYTLEDFVFGRIKEKCPLSQMEVRDIVSELLCMGAALEEKKLVHFDIKPANILKGLDGHWKLIDFDGVLAEGTEVSDGVSATPAYTSPEVAAMAVDGDILVVRDFIKKL